MLNKTRTAQHLRGLYRLTSWIGGAVPRTNQLSFYVAAWCMVPLDAEQTEPNARLAS